jgi:SAM-dependent methyltransferase
LKGRKGRRMNAENLDNPTDPTTIENWEKYWQEYEARDYVNYTPWIHGIILRHIELLGSRVLEVGAGTGGNASKLAALGASVTILDFAPAALARSVNTARKAGVHLQVMLADAHAVPCASRSFDLVYHQGFLEHFKEPAPLVREQHRILRAGGYLLVDVPQRYNFYTLYKRRLIRAGRWPYGGWEREFSLTELITLLEDSGFRFVDAYGRGYYPRALAMARNLIKVRKKLGGGGGAPGSPWQWYDATWRRFEQTWLGCNTLQCIGVLAQAVEVV